jgi:hypothetical protein
MAGCRRSFIRVVIVTHSSRSRTLTGASGFVLPFIHGPFQQYMMENLVLLHLVVSHEEEFAISATQGNFHEFKGRSEELDHTTNGLLSLPVRKGPLTGGNRINRNSGNGCYVGARPPQAASPAEYLRRVCLA